MPPVRFLPRYKVQVLSHCAGIAHLSVASAGGADPRGHQVHLR